MIERHQHAPSCVYLLADSLDSILAACEDWPTSHQVKPGTLLQLELAAITHVLQARRYIDELDAVDPTLVDQCVLFLTGTAALALEHLRGERSSPSLGRNSSSVAKDYLIGGQIPLGVLADVTGMMLDALEAHFVLYGDDAPPLNVDAAAILVAQASGPASKSTPFA